MNNYDIINFILLTIILALIIHIVLKNTYFNKKNIQTTSNNLPLKIIEVPNNVSNTNSNVSNTNNNISNTNNNVSEDNTYTNRIKEISVKQNTSDDIANINVSNKEDMKYPDENKDFELLVGNTTWNNQYDNGIISSEDKYTDDFFNEYVFYGRNRVKKSNLSNKEKINYRDNYFNFRDNVWTMPNHDNDGIDAINDMTLANSEGHMNIGQNKSIKDIYDSLTQRNFFFEQELNNNGKGCGETNNLGSFYETIGTGGQNNNVNLYTYKDDTVSNGNEYFNGVYANNNNSNEEPFSF
jgi:hypothetical protein